MANEKEICVVVVIAEGEIDSVHTSSADAEAAYFAEGVTFGASLYGGDGCSVYCHDELDQIDDAKLRGAAKRKVKRAMKGGDDV